MRYADGEVTIHAQYQVHYQFAVNHRGADFFNTKRCRGRNTVPAVEFFDSARIADHDLAGSRFRHRYVILQHRVSPPSALISNCSRRFTDNRYDAVYVLLLLQETDLDIVLREQLKNTKADITANISALHGQIE